MFPILLLVSAALAADPPSLRLPEGVRPVKYAADLTLLPDKLTFSGSIDIDVVFPAPTKLFYVNARELRIASATAGKTKLTPDQANENFLALTAPSSIPAGPTRLHFEYSGKISPKSSEGIFQGRDGDINYLFTQFEEIDARRAFPCFDEPGFKTPWQITLHVKSSDKAFANTPQVSETAEPNGMKKVVFAPTKPLPSYLVAFAVGPFDVVEAGRIGKTGAPVRIITPKGKASQAKYAAEVTATIIERLQDYFGIPYPYEKADAIAIPLTFGFGAMENAGLITYAENILLADPATDTEQRRRGYASVGAHELAHQWFGDLVTLAWWDDTWLNEAFATWTSSKILAEWRPEWKTRVSDLGAKFGAMSEDSLVTTRKIRQEILTNDDISNAFDGITYEKGAAVIRMFEIWAGEKEFQRGVNAYLKRHAYKNARMSDFLDAIGSSQPRLSAAFQTFLNQPGVPEISVALKCDGTPTLALRQKRYLPVGSKGSSAQTWQVPVCVRYPSAKGLERECFLLDKESAEFKLAKASSCPAMIAANESASGYYISSYEGAQLDQMVAQGRGFLNPAEQLTLLHDVASLANAGDLKIGRALDAAAQYADSPERQIVAEARSIVAGARQLLPDPLLDNYGRFVLKVFGARARTLGWSSKPGEEQETRLLRPQIVPFVARYDTALGAEARKLADGWLANRSGVDADMLGSILTTAAYRGDRTLFNTLLQELPKTQDKRQREAILAALTAFREPDLVAAALNLVIHSDIDTRETIGLLFSGTGNPKTRRMAFEFVKANYDEILKRAPSGGGSDFGAYLPYTASGFCDADSEKEFVDYFAERSKKFTGGPRVYEQALEGIRLCQTQKAAEGADAEAYFARQ
ncbi:MAG TPA: M1 family metallopeptidase [Bryobacteraceae bacterium]|nr:M1 family metallopeptidase [Bryobacteraceae bacterium]